MLKYLFFVYMIGWVFYMRKLKELVFEVSVEGFFILVLLMRICNLLFGIKILCFLSKCIFFWDKLMIKIDKYLLGKVWIRRFYECGDLLLVINYKYVF